MIEYKFSCPNCNQHILCNDAYSGLQIICPTCKNQIVVPPAPGAIPAKPAATVPLSPPAQAPTVATKPPAPSPAKRKSQPRWGMIGGAAALVLLGVAGVIAYVFHSNAFSKSEVATKPSVQKPTASKKPKAVPADGAPGAKNLPASNAAQSPSVAQNSNDSLTPSASEIVRKVVEQYDSLTSYSAKGKTISIIDMSGMDVSKIPNTGTKNSEQVKAAISKPQRIESDFSLKLGKPDFYRVEWEGQLGPQKSKGAVWSSGDGDYLLMDMGETKYAKMKTRELALATATGLSGGVANTMPEIFFKGQASLLNLFKSATRGEDETIANEDCYVVTGNAMGLKVHLWIRKSDFLIKQKQQVLGGKLETPEMNDAEMEENFKKLGGNPTDKQKAQMKEAMKKMKSMASQMKGTMTETYEKIEINQPLTKTDFNFEVPAGTKLSESLF